MKKYDQLAKFPFEPEEEAALNRGSSFAAVWASGLGY
jgi:hypothetical protein